MKGCPRHGTAHLFPDSPLCADPTCVARVVEAVSSRHPPSKRQWRRVKSEGVEEDFISFLSQRLLARKQQVIHLRDLIWAWDRYWNRIRIHDYRHQDGLGLSDDHRETITSQVAGASLSDTWEPEVAILAREVAEGLSLAAGHPDYVLYYTGGIHLHDLRSLEKRRTGQARSLAEVAAEAELWRRATAQWAEEHA